LRIVDCRIGGLLIEEYLDFFCFSLCGHYKGEVKSRKEKLKRKKWKVKISRVKLLFFIENPEMNNV